MGVDEMDWLTTALLSGDLGGAKFWFSLLIICLVSSSINASEACSAEGDIDPLAKSHATKPFLERCPAVTFVWVGLKPIGELCPSSFDTGDEGNGNFPIPLGKSDEALFLLSFGL
ncbi:hypothetical protein Ancab_015608 [Ancistrocladus abbreviatus]